MMWDEKKIGNVVDIIDGDRGTNYPKQSEFSDKGYCLFLNTGNVKKDGFNFENNSFISKQKDELLRKGKLSRGDLIYTTRGTIGNVAFYKSNIQYDNVRINSGMIILRCIHSEVLPDFLYQLLKSEFTRQRFQKYCTGSAQPQLPIKDFKNIEILLPPIETQKRIADILSAYDDLIENNKKQIKLLEEMAQRLYKEWFIDLRFPDYENTEIIDGVPKGWKIRLVSDFGEVITGKTPSTANASYYGGNIPFVKIPDMHNVVYPLATEVSLTRIGADTQKSKFLPKNSVMVSCIATVGLVNLTVENCQTNQQINSIIPNREEDTYFIYSAMKLIKGLLDGVGSNGATMTNVNKSKFCNIEILSPTRVLNDAYYNYCKPLFEKMLALSKGVQNAQHARDCLLPKLMSGEIEV